MARSLESAELLALAIGCIPQARRGDAPFYEAARDVLKGTLSKFLASDDWRAWAADAPPVSMAQMDGATEAEEDELAADPASTGTPSETDSADVSTERVWDGWD